VIAPSDAKPVGVFPQRRIFRIHCGSSGVAEIGPAHFEFVGDAGGKFAPVPPNFPYLDLFCITLVR